VEKIKENWPFFSWAKKGTLGSKKSIVFKAEEKKGKTSRNISGQDAQEKTKDGNGRLLIGAARKPAKPL